VGKQAADDLVERRFYERAVGYTYDAVKVFMPAGAIEPVYASYREHIPPDVNAARFWSARNAHFQHSAQLNIK
jgi:hypothetical protein